MIIHISTNQMALEEERIAEYFTDLEVQVVKDYFRHDIKAPDRRGSNRALSHAFRKGALFWGARANAPAKI